jgi:hypothetical protein
MSEPNEIIPDQCLSNYPKTDNPFRMYDPENKADINLAKSLQQELNEISSAPAEVYLLLDTEIDPLLGETKDAIYGPPITVIGHYSFQDLKFELAKWGIDSETEFLIFFVKDELLNKCGRLLQQGDLIRDVVRSMLFEVMEQFEDSASSFKFQFINQYVLCKRKIGDTSTLPGEYVNPPEGETHQETEKTKEEQDKNFFSY